LASSGLPAGCTARPIELDDIPALVAMFRRRDEALGVAPEPVDAFLSWMLRLPYVRRERDTVVVECGADVVGSLTMQHDPAAVGSHLTFEIGVDPSASDLALERWLVDRAEAVAAERADERPSAVHAIVVAGDESQETLLASRGYRHVRVTHEMEIALDGPRCDVPLPGGITARTFEPGRDERTFWRVHEEAFEGHFGFVPKPYESFAAEWYESDDWDPSRVLFAEVDGHVVAEVAWIDAGADGYIPSLGVVPAYRRRGIAAALLSRAFDDVAAAGKARATLSVDTENATGAVGVYERAGMRAYRAWHVYERPAP
jgi:mycothiol synthase